MLLIPILCASVMLQAKPISIDMVLGKGEAAQKGDIVTVLYRGTLQDGKVFDENFKKEPFVFTLGAGQVIKGWDEGVVGMKLGGKRVLQLAPELAYGKDGAGPIPANATLIFEVELLRIQKADYKPMIEIQEIKEGSGKAAEEGDQIEVHYTGTFLNGTKFDSSKDRGTPLAVTIGKTGLIKGFTEGLKGLKVGGIRKVTIPYQLAYGESGRPPVIPPMSTLVFELELVSNKGK